MVFLALAAAAASVVLFMVGLRSVMSLASDRRRLAAAIAGVEDVRDMPLVERYDRVFRRTRVGRLVERELTLAGINRPPVVVAGLSALSGVGVAWVLWTALAPVFGVLGLFSGILIARVFIRRAKARRTEVFIGQMPELARVLANATNAGLSIATAIGIAGDELDEPARSEMQRVSSALKFGGDIEAALTEMGQRVPSREVAVLLSTLVVCARSGGSLVTSLRDIADTLEARKETRREIRTTLAQSLATGYLVIVLGFGMLFLLNSIQPGTVEAMTTSFLGQVALVVAGALFVGGFFLIRRMTKVDL